jgi:hypothetical protein
MLIVQHYTALLCGQTRTSQNINPQTQKCASKTLFESRACENIDDCRTTSRGNW